MKAPDPTVWRTPHRLCPACQAQRVHAASELTLYHPFSGHGFNGTLWSHQALDQAYRRMDEYRQGSQTLRGGG